MKYLALSLSTCVSLTITWGLVACQHSKVSDQISHQGKQKYGYAWEEYDYIYDQLDRKEKRDQKQHLWATPILSKKEARLLIHASLKQETKKPVPHKERLVSKLQRAVDRAIAETLKKRGLEAESVNVHVQLSYK